VEVPVDGEEGTLMKASAMPDVLEIGEGRTLRFFDNDAGDIVGAFETHPRLMANGPYPVGSPCEGAIHFDVPEAGIVRRPKWTVESWEPLTLSPSVLCRGCGNHGWVKQGKWVAA
jgi:hypothetical protein